LPGSERAITTPAPIDIAGDTAKPRFRFRTVCKISGNDPAQARARLSQALQTARSLQEAGRLAPVDSWMPDELARRLAALDPS
jgi:hypothetical protein